MIFSKYKQTLPLEVGIDNGPDVLDCIQNFLDPWKEEQGMNYHYLIECEKKYFYEMEKLGVFERIYDGNNDHHELKEQTLIFQQTTDDLLMLKTSLGISLLETGMKIIEVKGNLSPTAPEFVEQLLRSLIPITTVTLSQVLTKAGADVDV